MAPRKTPSTALSWLQQTPWCNQKYWLSACLGLATLAGILLLMRPAGDGEDPVVRVGHYDNEPKVYTNVRGEPAGLFVELLQEMAHQEGWRLEFVDCVWADCLQALLAGDLDLMPDVALSADREEWLAFHQQPVSQAWSQFYTRTDLTISDFDDLEGLRIAVLAESVQAQFLDDLAADQALTLTLVETDDILSGFELVAAEAADAVVANNFFGSRHRGRFGLFNSPLSFNQVGLYYASRAGQHEAILQRIDHHLDRWLEDPRSPYYRAMSTALSVPTDATIPRWLVAAGSVLVAVTLLLVLLTCLLRWTVRHRTAELRETSHRLSHLLSSSPVVVYALKGPALKPAWISDNVSRIFGFAPREVMAEGWWEQQLHPDDRMRLLAEREKILQQGHLRREYRIRDAANRVRHVRDEQQLTEDEHGQPEVVGTWTDLTRSYEQEARVSYLTYYDGLTGLPNRTLLTDRLYHAIGLALQQRYEVAVILIDLDRFKSINDTLSLRTGDQVLKAVAERLRDQRPLDTLARISADEFVLVLERPPGAERLREILQELVSAIRQPIPLADDAITITASIGYARFPEHSTEAQTLVSRAELAMTEAKRAGGDSWCVYEPGMGLRSQEHFALENELRQALQREQLVLFYQPQLDLQTGDLLGMEALVRWLHPVRGPVPPSQFIPVAERTGLIHELDEWVLNAACRQLRDWDSTGFHVPHVACNVSALELGDRTLFSRIEAALDTAGLAPGRLELELTESTLTRAPEQALEVLSRLQALGVQIAMDDFGTGYSNLVQLGNLPVQVLKIDQSFVQHLGRSPVMESITRAVVAMADALSLRLVAEGIETEQQKAFLRRIGCNAGQGYLLDRPMPAADAYARYHGSERERMQRRN